MHHRICRGPADGSRTYDGKERERHGSRSTSDHDGWRMLAQIAVAKFAEEKEGLGRALEAEFAR